MINAHPNISNSSLLVAKDAFGELFLSKDSENPWLIYVPKLEVSKVDWNDLSDDEVRLIGLKTKQYGQALKDLFSPEKINVAQFGNITRQFHIHIVARFKDDRAWPDSIIGTKPKSTVDHEKLEKWSNDIAQKIQ
jgi:diadenosine tetraphosphate (Ap4A) HIT family hydrolase